MQVEVTVLFGIIGLVISVAAFLFGRQSAAKTEGVAEGKIGTTLDFILNDLKDIKAQNRLNSDQIVAIKTDIEVLKRDLKTAFNKIDEMKEKQ